LADSVEFVEGFLTERQAIGRLGELLWLGLDH